MKHDDKQLGGANGWIEDSNSWSYSSADSPSFVISINADMTGVLSPGMKVRLNQTTTKYFIITAVGAYVGGVTLITVYGGTDYTLTADAIVLPAFSHQRVPFGFPMNPNIWTVDASTLMQAGISSPVSGTWYNASGISITLPIGCWQVEYNVSVGINDTSFNIFRAYSTLSTGTSVESDPDMTCWLNYVNAGGNTNWQFFSIMERNKVFLISSKTIEYLLIKTTQNTIDSLSIPSSNHKTILRARCSYL